MVESTGTNYKRNNVGAKYKIIVPASQVFIPGLTVFMRSFLEYHSPEIGVILLNYDLPDDFISQWPFERVIQLSTKRGPSVECKLASYRIMGDFDTVVMLADADSFFLANINHLFDIASLGYLVGSANGQNIRFQQSYEDLTKIPVAGKTQYRTIAAPYFADCRIYGWLFKEAVTAWESIGQNHSTSIWMLFNAMITKYNLMDAVITFPAQQITNLHQKMLKPGTRVRMDAGRLMTEDGLQVLMVHDKWWRPNFMEGLMKMGERFSTSFDARKNHTLNQWRQSRDLIKAEFDKYLEEPKHDNDTS